MTARPERPSPRPSPRPPGAAGLSPLDEASIRAALVAHLRTAHAAEPDALVVEELGLCEGAARVDVAVVNGALAGFEIKSDHDTLERLPRQRRLYGRVLDAVTVVVGDAWLAQARRRVPGWWGVMRAVRGPSPTSAHGAAPGVLLELVRAPRDNPAPDPFALAQLLWRDEALAALRARGLAAGCTRAPRRELWRRLADNVPAPELRALVRDALKARAGAWRAGARSG